jgi:hypothetical protein
MDETIHEVARTLNDAGALRVIFPLLTLIGPALFGYYGYLGVAKRRTLVLGGRVRGAGAWWVTGAWAMVLGAFYLVLGPLLLISMGTVATAMFGLW